MHNLPLFGDVIEIIATVTVAMLAFGPLGLLVRDEAFGVDVL